MPTNEIVLGQTPEPAPRKAAAKLLQVAALAAVLVPLGSVAVETATITCGFSYTSNVYGGSGCNGGDQTATNDTSRFDFGEDFRSWPSRSFRIQPILR